MLIFGFSLFSAAQKEQHFDSFSRAKNGSVFHIGQGEKSGGKHKAKYGFAARGAICQRSGWRGKAAVRPVAAAARLS